jgi:ABC-type multidrug transport system fused ATPase/permease subunit
MSGPGSNAKRREPHITASPMRRRLLAYLVLNGLGQAACATLVGQGVRRAFHLVRHGASFDLKTYGLVAGFFLTAAVASGWLRSRERYDAERLGQHYVHQLRVALYDRLAAMSPRELQRRTHGGVIVRFVGDLTQIRQWVSLGLARLVVGTTTVLGAIAALALLNVVLAAAVAVVLLFAGVGAGLMGAPLRERVRRARRRRVRLAANISEQASALAVVQVFGQTEAERKRMIRQSRLLRRAMVGRARALGQLRGLSEAAAVLAPAVVLLAGAEEVQAGRASAGTVVAAMTVAGILTAAVRDLGRVPEYWNGANVALERARIFLNLPVLEPDRPWAAPVPRGPGWLAFANAGLEGQLEGVDAVAEPGSVVAVVGDNGAGKSTLLALAARLADPDTGSVMLDGYDLRDIKKRSLRRAISIASPDLPLLRGTVESNLRYRDPEASDAELARVRALTGLDEVLAGFDQGLDSPVTERGRNLSAGQQTRVALARALVGDPRILLLDEVEAHLDADAAAVVERVIEDRRGRKTTIVVTHRPEIAASADVVWRLSEGRLIATGPPAAVLL